MIQSSFSPCPGTRRVLVLLLASVMTACSPAETPAPQVLPPDPPASIPVAAAPSSSASPASTPVAAVAATTTTDPPPAAPVASAAQGPQAALTPSLTCDGGRGPSIKAATPDKAAPPVAGQMTEQSAQAKRLFDAEKWDQALPALQRVAKGETGDDEGQKQLSDYHVGIVLFRLKRFDEAYKTFRPMALHSSHLKHNETMLWMTKIADIHPELVSLSDLAAYTPMEVARFNNQNQQIVFQSLSYLLGRERLGEGKTAEAKTLLQQVAETHPYAAAAKKCIALAK